MYMYMYKTGSNRHETWWVNPVFLKPKISIFPKKSVFSIISGVKM